MDILQTIVQGITVIITNDLTIGATSIGDRIIAVMPGRENNTAMCTAAAGTPMTEGCPTKAANPVVVMTDDVVRIHESIQVGDARQHLGVPDQKG